MTPHVHEEGGGPLAGLRLGEVFRTQRRTLGEGDFALLTNLTWTTGESHVDRLRDAPYDESEDPRWLALPVVGAVIVGLAAKHWISYHLTRVVGLRVLDSSKLEIEGHAKVRSGDTLYAECELVAGRVEDDGVTAVLEVEERGFNQRGELVATVRQRWRVRRVPADGLS